jgi:hypothetical protein
MFYATFDASARTTDLRVGVSMDAWETVITQKPDRVGRQAFSKDGEQWTVTFQNRKAAAGKAADKTLVRHTVPRGRLAVRLVTVGDDGSEHATLLEPSWDGGHPADVQHHRRLSSMTEFRLQVRPYHWVEFQNISLQIGQGTDMRVLSPDAPKKPEK